MKIIDVSAGNRAVWINKTNPLATFIDIRPEVEPDIVADSCNLPLPDDEFDLGVFDPPHCNFGATSEMAQTYGHHTAAEIRDIVRGTSKELSRVIKANGLVAFKWNDHDIKLKTVLDLMPEFEPLFGAVTTMRTKHSSMTQWLLLRNRKGDVQ